MEVSAAGCLEPLSCYFSHPLEVLMHLALSRTMHQSVPRLLYASLEVNFHQFHSGDSSETSTYSLGISKSIPKGNAEVLAAESLALADSGCSSLMMVTWTV